MKNAKELKELSLMPSEHHDMVVKLTDEFNAVVEKCFDEMTKNTSERHRYRERPLFVISKNYSKEVVVEFAKDIEKMGYITASDPVYGSYIVLFDEKVCWTPYRFVLKA